jgi:antitoxin MazE
MLLKRSIVRIGNSLGVIIPSVFLEELGVTHKDEVEIEFDKKMKVVTIGNKETILSENYLEKVVKSIVDDYLKDKGL